MAEDPFASFISNSIYSSSQEDLFNTSLHVRQNEHFPDPILPEPYPPPPSPTTNAFAGGGIVICSAPETPISNSAASPSAEEVFRTPPEEPRRSSSEEPPPPPPPEISSRGGELESPAVNLDGGTPDLGFPREGKIVEVLSNGKVRVGEVSAVDLESFRVGEKRTPHKRTPIQEPSPSPSKRIRVSAKLVITPKLVTRGEGECSAKRRVEFPIEMEVKAKMSVQTEECNVDTEVIEDSDDEQSCGNDVGISNVQEMENGNGNREGGGDMAEDLSKQRRRELPSWACRKEDTREDESRLNTEPEQAVDYDLRLVMEVMALLSKEEGPSRGTGDILETVKGRGLTFPEPKWWHDNDGDQDEA